MAIRLTLDRMLVERKVKSKDLAAHLEITEANLSLLKNGKLKGVRLETLDKMCRFLDCQPGDLLEFDPNA